MTAVTTAERKRKLTIHSYRSIAKRRTRTLSIRGVDYCINEWGDSDREPLFYLHGWADTGSTFQFVVDAMAEGTHVIAPDWRGFGRSNASAEAYWFPDYIADLHAILGIYSPHAPVNLVGHSMGGNVASLYAGIMPERVAALVNVEGFGLTDSDPLDAPKRYREWLEAGKPSFSTYSDFQSLAARLCKRSPALSDAQADFVAREWAMEDSDRVRLRADPNHKLPNAVLYRRAEAEACWRNIAAATLLVTGTDSPFQLREPGGETSLLAKATTCLIEGVGHMIHFEAPERLATEIEQFLKKTL